MVLSGSGKTMLGAAAITAGNIAEVATGKISLYFMGRITYRDIFEGTPEHHYGWCVLVIPNDLVTDRFSYIGVMEKTE
jgi:hypothetical protein